MKLDLFDGISNGGKRSRSAGAGEPVRKGDAKSPTNTANGEADIDYVDQNIDDTKQYKRYYFEYASDDGTDVIIPVRDPKEKEMKMCLDWVRRFPDNRITRLT